MDDVGRLIHHAGAREPVDTERLEKARGRVAAHWQNVVEDRQANRRVSRFRFVAVAASLVAAIGASLFYLQQTNNPPPIEIAKVDRVIGAVKIADLTAVTGVVVEEDTLIETDSNGRVALRMAGGQSLRIDTSSRLVVHSPNHVSLEKGGVYIDTQPATDSLPVLVSTPMGTARDVGTQFQVRLAASVLIVGVRDGLVEVAPQGQENVSVNKGRYVELTLTGEKSERQLQSDDPSWDWVETIVPEFDIEGISLKQYLLWYANERGVVLDWEDRISEEKAEKILLSGSIDGASLSEGLQIVRQIAPFDYRFDGDSMWIKLD